MEAIYDDELAILKCVVRDPALFSKVRQVLSENDFSKQKNRILFAALNELNSNAANWDLVTIKRHIISNQLMTESEVLVVLSELEFCVGVPINLDAYLHTVKRASNRIKLAAKVENLSRLMTGGTNAGDDLEAKIMTEVHKIENLCDTDVSPSRITTVNLGQFLSKEIRPRKNIISPWLPEQGLAMIYAAPGVGKTFLALNLAYAVSSGQPFLGWPISEPRRVLYLDGEMASFDLQQRLSSIVKSYEHEGVGENFKLMTPDLQNFELLDLSTEAGQRELDPFVEDVDLIIVDNISCLCRSGRENEAEGWISTQQWALRMKASGKSVIFLHHTSKNGQDQRGTGKRKDILDTAILLQRPKDYQPSDGAIFELHFKKSRGFSGPEAASRLVKMVMEPNDSQHWVSETLEESTFDKVVTLAKQGLSQKEISDELELNKSTVCRHFRKAQEGGLLYV